MNWRRLLAYLFLAGVVGFLAIQLIPYGRDHRNPPVKAEPNWDSPATRALVVRACYDCHSNETVRPWYGNIAPSSWLLQHDIDEGRATLNFSEWDVPQPAISLASSAVQRGKMPPSYYVLMHPAANLAATEKQQLIDGLNAMARQAAGR